MKESKEDFFLVFKKLLKFLERMSEEEYQELIDGELQFSLKSTKKTKKKVQDKKVKERSELEELGRRIASSKKREEALRLLTKDNRYSKSDLLTLADIFDINVTKKDSLKVIHGKIIESLLGPKIRSKVIMNLDLKEK